MVLLHGKKHHGFGRMVFSIGIDTFYHSNSEFYINSVHWKSCPYRSEYKIADGADFSCHISEMCIFSHFNLSYIFSVSELS